MKKIILLLVFIFVSFFSVNPAFAENFYITDYDVKMNVNEDKSVDVVETIDVIFTNPSHGIYRTIPLQNNKIKNIKVSEQNKVTNNGTDINIKIGSPDKFIYGKHNYQLSYTYYFLDNKNEFYYNIIGTGWNTTISKVTFGITMPKNIDAKNVGLSIGKHGTKGFEDGAIFRVYKNKISGNVYKKLLPNEGVTIRAEVDKNYFSESSLLKYYDNLHNISIIIILVLTIISVLIWYFLGKDNHVTPVVSFYPPENVNSVEAEIINKGKCTFQGLVALLIELAGKGYIKIKENSEENTFRLYRINAQEDQQKAKLSPSEKEYLNIIFEDEQTVSNFDLERSSVFYKNCQKLINKINKRIPKHYETSKLRDFFKMSLFACFISIFLLMVCGILNFTMPNNYQFVVLLFYIPFLFIFIPIIFRQTSVSIIVTIIYLCLHCYLMLLGSGVKFHANTLFYTGLICSIISGICIYFFPKRNILGTKLEGELRGLKHFIEVTDKKRLETLVYENPEYFYNILPYAYILGVSNKWIENFESIVMPRSEDQISLYTNINAFKSFTNSFYKCTLPSQQNGGIRFSNGRGGGGGGGRSW